MPSSFFQSNRRLIALLAATTALGLAHDPSQVQAAEEPVSENSVELVSPDTTTTNVALAENEAGQDSDLSTEESQPEMTETQTSQAEENVETSSNEENQANPDSATSPSQEAPSQSTDQALPEGEVLQPASHIDAGRIPQRIQKGDRYRATADVDNSLNTEAAQLKFGVAHDSNPNHLIWESQASIPPGQKAQVEGISVANDSSNDTSLVLFNESSYPLGVSNIQIADLPYTQEELDAVYEELAEQLPEPSLDFRVKPYLQSPSSNSIAINWVSEFDTPGQITVTNAETGEVHVSLTADPIYLPLSEYTSKELEERISFNNGSQAGSQSLEKGSWLLSNSNYKSEVDLINFQADTLYEYTIQQGDSVYTDYFRTFPTSENWDHIRLIAFSDSETEPKGRLENREWELHALDTRYAEGSEERPGPDSAWAAKHGTARRNEEILVRYPLTQYTALNENIKHIEAAQPDALIIAGDLTQGAGYQPAWDEFWRHFAGEESELAGSVPILSALGNWETYGSINEGYQNAAKSRNKYHDYMDTPGDANNPQYKDSYYRTDIGPITLITLDSTKGIPHETTSEPLGKKYGQAYGTAHDDTVLQEELWHTAQSINQALDIDPYLTTDTQGSFTWEEYTDMFLKVYPDLTAEDVDLPGFNPGTQQWLWAIDQLQDARQKGQIILVQFHHAPYSSGVHGMAPNFEVPDNQSGVAMRVYTPLFEEYGVAAVIAGHDEMFERSYVDKNGDGIGFYVYDVGVAADGLRSEKMVKDENGVFQPLNYNSHTEWSATADAPEFWATNENGVKHLIDGGLHYGHLQIDLENTDDGPVMTLAPFYIFPILDDQYDLIETELRLYSDVQRIYFNADGTIKGYENLSYRELEGQDYYDDGRIPHRIERDTEYIGYVSVTNPNTESVDIKIGVAHDGDPTWLIWEATETVAPGQTAYLELQAKTSDASNDTHLMVFNLSDQAVIIDVPSIVIENAPVEQVTQIEIGNSVTDERGTTDIVDVTLGDPLEVIVEVELSNQPDRITISLAEDPSNEMNFNWFAKDSLDDAALYISKSSDMADAVTFAASAEEVPSTYYGRNADGNFVYMVDNKPGRSNPEDYYGYFLDNQISRGNSQWTGGSTGNAEVYVHEGISEHAYKARASDLEPNTTYYYQVGSPSQGLSDVYSFKTAGQSGDPFKFIHYTDTQNAYWNENVRNEAEFGADTAKAAFELVPDAAFAVHTGDIVEVSESEDEWTDILNRLNPVAANLPHAYVAGNHDASEGAFNNHFNVPLPEGEAGINRGSYYSLDYNGAHIVVLNTNDSVANPNNPEGKAISDAQLAWLDADLAAAKENPETNWLIVAYHKPIFSSSYHSLQDTDVQKSREDLMAIIDKHDVDLVLNGHDHVLTVSQPLTYNGIAFADGELADDIKLSYDADGHPVISSSGTIFVIPNTAGTKLYDDIYNMDLDHIENVRRRVFQALGETEAEKQANLDYYNQLFMIDDQPNVSDYFEVSHSNRREGSVQNFAVYTVTKDAIKVDVWEVSGEDPSQERIPYEVASFTIVKEAAEDALDVDRVISSYQPETSGEVPGQVNVTEPKDPIKTGETGQDDQISPDDDKTQVIEDDDKDGQTASDDHQEPVTSETDDTSGSDKKLPASDDDKETDDTSSEQPRQTLGGKPISLSKSDEGRYQDADDDYTVDLDQAGDVSEIVITDLDDTNLEKETAANYFNQADIDLYHIEALDASGQPVDTKSGRISLPQTKDQAVARVVHHGDHFDLLEDLTFTIEDGQIIFETRAFSYFSVVYAPSTQADVSNQDKEAGKLPGESSAQETSKKSDQKQAKALSEKVGPTTSPSQKASATAKTSEKEKLPKTGSSNLLGLGLASILSGLGFSGLKRRRK